MFDISGCSTQYQLRENSSSFEVRTNIKWLNSMCFIHIVILIASVFSRILKLSFFSDSCGDLWEGGNSSRSILLTMDKIIVAWDWDSIISKL